MFRDDMIAQHIRTKEPFVTERATHPGCFLVQQAMPFESLLGTRLAPADVANQRPRMSSSNVGSNK